MLDVRQLDFDYPEQSVLRGVNFSVPSGSLLHVQGANGAGKTTLLSLLAGLFPPTQGSIQYQGIFIHQNRSAYQRALCYVGNRPGISQVLTVRENCQFDLHQGRRPIAFDELIRAFSLEGLEDQRCGLLSLGQRKRVSLMRLLISDASLWLLDEPLNALDNQGVMMLMTLLTNHMTHGGIVVLTSHQRLPFCSEQYQDYLL